MKGLVSLVAASLARLRLTARGDDEFSIVVNVDLMLVLMLFSFCSARVAGVSRLQRSGAAGVAVAPSHPHSIATLLAFDRTIWTTLATAACDCALRRQVRYNARSYQSGLHVADHPYRPRSNAETFGTLARQRSSYIISNHRMRQRQGVRPQPSVSQGCFRLMTILQSRSQSSIR